MLNYRKLSDYEYLSADVNVLYKDLSEEAWLIALVLVLIWMLTLPIIFIKVVKSSKSKDLSYDFGIY